jgi:hypothetical protein
MQVVDSKLASVTFLLICEVEVFSHSSAMLLSSIKAYRMEMLNTHQWALWSGTFPGLSFCGLHGSALNLAVWFFMFYMFCYSIKLH